MQFARGGGRSSSVEEKPAHQVEAANGARTALREGMTIRVAGESGEGVITTGEMLSWALSRAGWWVSTFRTYPAEIRGGPCMFQVRVHSQPLDSATGAVDVLVAFNDEAIALHQDAVRPGGVILYDLPSGGQRPAGLRSDVVARGVPFGEVALQRLQNRLSKNMVALGATYAAMNLPPDSAEEFVRRRFQAKGQDVVDVNVRAIELGYQLAREQLSGIPALAHLSDTQAVRKAEQAGGTATRAVRRVLLSGNQALSLGAIAGGCRYYAGYPITPASDILEFMAAHLPSFGGVVIQTEDEIAALASALGASFGGVPAMTATSGPGFDLMVELLGLGVMSELPVVIVDVQRAGPSTGMPTKTEQGDLYGAIFAGHGEAPRVVLAPLHVRDCYEVGRQAFQLAEAYQTPVVVLSELALAQRTETVEQPEPEEAARPPVGSVRLATGRNGEFRRYVDTETGVSARSLPGDPAGLHVITGLEHDDYGHPNYDPEVHRRMTAKRYRKMERLREQAEAQPQHWTAEFGTPQARIGLLGWGSTFGAAREAARMAERMGVGVRGLWVKLLAPLPVNAIRRFMEGLEVVLVAELNASGQFLHYLGSQGVVGPLVGINKQEGLPFSPDDILARILEVARA